MLCADCGYFQYRLRIYFGGESQFTAIFNHGYFQLILRESSLFSGTFYQLYSLDKYIYQVSQASNNNNHTVLNNTYNNTLL